MTEAESKLQKRRFEPKDYLTVTLSTLAFIVSAGSAYINIVKTDESVILVSHTEPFVSLKDNKLVLSRESEGRIALINSGNRTVIVSDVVLFYLQPAEASKPAVCDMK